eukprot:1870474-Alexandrium_andersonii.AAC.1
MNLPAKLVALLWQARKRPGPTSKIFGGVKGSGDWQMGAARWARRALRGAVVAERVLVAGR